MRHIRSHAVIAVGAALLLAAAGVLAWSAVTTTTARVSASTDAVGFINAGTIDLSTENSKQGFLFDTAGLYPGVTTEGCVDIDYSGTISGDLRLYATPAQSSGLDRFLDVVVEVSDRPGGCESFGPGTRLYQGRLDRFWRDHDRFGTGLTVAEGIEGGARVALRVRAEVVDDDAAQGLAVEFTMVAEVRP